MASFDLRMTGETELNATLNALPELVAMRALSGAMRKGIRTLVTPVAMRIPVVRGELISKIRPQIGKKGGKVDSDFIAVQLHIKPVDRKTAAGSAVELGTEDTKAAQFARDAFDANVNGLMSTIVNDLQRRVDRLK